MYLELQEMNKHVTYNQARKLKAIGFKEPTHDRFKTGLNPKVSKTTLLTDWNHFIFSVSAPTVDEAIDWLRRKYNIHIYTCIEPFVDPQDTNGSVLYRYGVKWCDQRNGWNGRIIIGKTKLSKNPLSLKRQAITFALRWITKNNIKKLSK